MSKRLLKFVRLLFNMGTFSRPFLSFLDEDLLSKPKNNYERSWHHFLKAIILEQSNSFSESMDELIMSENYCQNSSLKFLILGRRLSMMMKQRRFEEANKIYLKLRKDISKIPPMVRPSLVTILTSYCLKKDSSQNCLGKIHVEKLDGRLQAFVLLNTAREKAAKGDVSQAFSMLNKSYRLSKDNFHPAGMIFSLNASAWYIRKRHPIMSSYIGEKAIYTSGYYSELTKYFFTLDTLFTVMFILKDPKIVDYARVICAFEPIMNLMQKNNYSKALEKASEFERLLESNENTYECKGKLRKYLISFSKNISYLSSITGVDRVTLTDIFKSRKQIVRGETLRKFIKGLKIEVDIFEDPEPIVIEYLKLKKLGEAKKYLRILAKMDIRDRKREIMSVYSAVFGRNYKIHSLVRKGSMDRLFYTLDNLPELEATMIEKNEWQYFLYIAHNLTSYEKARKDLMDRFIGLIPFRGRDIFYSEYFKLIDKERLVIDIFIRNYLRYRREWGVRLENSEYTQISKKAKMKTQPFLIAMYYFKHKKDRKIVLDFLQRASTRYISK